MADTVQVRVSPSPDWVPSSTGNLANEENHSLEGLATNIMLLLKLVQDHNETCSKTSDDRKTKRLAGMMTILDDVKTRIQKSQYHVKRKDAELRRCLTEVRRCGRREKKSDEIVVDEKERLRKQLSASLAARKSLEIMCSSLGKEKEIMAAELYKKVQELNETEEHLNDLKAQNEMLLAKVQAYTSAQQREKRRDGETQGNAILHQRNEELSQQLLKSLDGYRYMKRKFKDTRDENMELRATMEELGMEITSGLNRVQNFKHCVGTQLEESTNVRDKIAALENVFQRCETKVANHTQKNMHTHRSKAKITTGKSFLVA